MAEDNRERIGQIMHESWSRTKRAQGFHGPDDACAYCDREHPIPHCTRYHADLIPWERLPKKQQDINRHAFDDVLREFDLVPEFGDGGESAGAKPAKDGVERARERLRAYGYIAEHQSCPGKLACDLTFETLAELLARDADHERQKERRALERHLPPGYDLGDDATVELAVKLEELQTAYAALEKAAEEVVLPCVQYGKQWHMVDDSLIRALRSALEQVRKAKEK